VEYEAHASETMALGEIWKALDVHALSRKRRRKAYCANIRTRYLGSRCALGICGVGGAAESEDGKIKELGGAPHDC
jgi:hypothetical protein